ncbi:MAG: hypothetical protein AB1476_02450 [Candidatus Hadarchaeota archaeon]
MKKLPIALIVLVVLGLTASQVIRAQEEPPDEGSIPPQTPGDAPGIGQGEAGENTENAAGGRPTGIGDVPVLVAEVVIVLVVVGAIAALLLRRRRSGLYEVPQEVPNIPQQPA